MNKLLYTIIPAILLVLHSCGTSQEKSHSLLEAKAFGDKMHTTPEVIVLDVRTAEEFAEGHIAHAVNIDWNGTEFAAEAAKLDKTKPCFVYCLAGGRSAAAVEQLRKMGFGTIYELKGGMLQWREEHLPEIAQQQQPGTGGMTEAAFKELIADKRYVLVDFYAEWCGPCKKMKPILDEIATRNGSTVKVVRIDVEQHPDLAAAMRVEGLPTLLIIKNNAVVWQKTGFAEEQELLEQLQ
jgi:thioredoxin 1